MERFFKRYLWTLNVAVVAIAGVLVARTVSALVAGRLVEPPSTTPAAGARHHVTTPVAASTVDAKALADLFGVTLPDADAAKKQAAAQAALPPPGTEVPTTLNATLVATIEASPDEYSLAVITDNSTRDTGVYGVGDTLMSTATLVKVERRRVLVNNNGRTEVLSMDADEEGKSPVAGNQPRIHQVNAFERQNPSNDGGGGIRQTDANHYVVAQSTIEHTLSNLNDIATQARIVPAFKNGVAEGFKLFSIRPGSLYAKIGIQNGDVIQRINGFEINSPDKALEVYQKLRDARRVEIQLDRRGQTVTKTYNIE